MKYAYDVLVPSRYYCDLIFTGLPEVPRLGAELFSLGFEMTPAGSFLTVATLHRLGWRTGWITDLGNDLFSQFILDMIRRDGLNTHLVRIHDFPLRNVSVSFSFTDDRGFISFSDRYAEPPLTPLIVQNPARCLLIPDLGFALTHPSALAAARQHGGLIYLDCQFTRSTLEQPEVREALRAADIFAPNASEAMGLTQTTTVTEALARLAELVPQVVIKCGAEGAVARRGTEVARAPAIPRAVLDTTGAGDCFNAGFISAYLCGEPLDVCLRWGNICGWISATGPGSTQIPTRQQIEYWLNQPAPPA